MNGSQPYTTVSAAARKEPDILCRLPAPTDDNPYSAGHASGDCPLRVVPQSREFIRHPNRDFARTDGPYRLVPDYRDRDAAGARHPLEDPSRPHRPQAVQLGAELEDSRLSGARADGLPQYLVAHAMVTFGCTVTEGCAVACDLTDVAMVCVWSFPLCVSIAFQAWLVRRAFGILIAMSGSFLIQAMLVIGVAV